LSYRSGLDGLAETAIPGGRAGLLSHYAAITADFRQSAHAIAEDSRLTLSALFGPQHGFRGETQDNMIEWEGYTHPTLGIPVYSLYGQTREPPPETLMEIDCFLIDLQDVGSRYYTYIYTMALCLRKCAEAGIPVVVLDRPNPTGLRIVEGKPLDPSFSSFVGMYPIPVRHALTAGELARLFCRLDGLPDPQVVKMRGCPVEGFPPNAPWVLPSPNMPSVSTALVYPGMCLLEGTSLSEGRGTVRPFEIFGAPWIDGAELSASLNGGRFMEGALLRPHSFIPTFGKHSGRLCGGAQIHVMDPVIFRPFRAALGILLHCFEREETTWLDPPYEYEYDKMPIDILSGGTGVRTAVEKHDAESLLELARGDPSRQCEMVSDIILYGRGFVE
jgi:uncharacterized protein YbbC (DUF1343 family)